MKAVLRPFLLIFLITVGAPFAAGNSTLFVTTPSNSTGGPQPLSASASFSLLGNQLTIRLTNSSTVTPETTVDSEVLTGLYFSTQSLNLTPVSAVTSDVDGRSGNTLCPGGCDTGTSWQFQSFNSIQNGAGISAVGTDGLQQSNFGGGTAVYGILPTDAPLGSLGLGSYALKMATFTLTVPDTFSLSYVDHVTFVWNTYDPVSPFQDEAPEPGSLFLVAGAVASLGARYCVSRIRQMNRQ
jgi:hypothetical protein